MILRRLRPEEKDLEAAWGVPMALACIEEERDVAARRIDATRLSVRRIRWICEFQQPLRGNDVNEYIHKQNVIITYCILKM